MAEGNAGTTTAIFTVTLSASTLLPITVDFGTDDDTAIVGGAATTGGADYLTNSGTLTFTPSGPLTQTVSITINGDALHEANETFNLVLTNATNADISKATGIGTITNDDALPSLSVANITVTEGNSGTTTAAFTVTLSAPSGQTVTASYSFIDGTGTAGADYQSTTGSLTFAPGELSKQIDVTILGDSLDEADENFSIAFAMVVNASVVPGGFCTITDDDAAPTISIDDVLQTEGNAGMLTTYTFDVSLSAASGRTVSVAYATAANTASAVSDFVTTAGMVTFAPGETSKPVVVTVNGDGVVEMDESFFVNLSTPVNATIADAQGIGFIVNDDAAGPTISLNSVNILEGNAGTTTMTFTATLSAATTSVVTVRYSTRDGSATAGGAAATGGRDYDATSGILTFPVGSMSQTFTVTINGDMLDEANETFTVELSGAVNASLLAISRLGTIINDDLAPLVSVNDVSLSEGTAGTQAAIFTVSLSAPSGRSTTVLLSTTDGTASSAAGFGQNDFGSIVGTTVTFPAGLTSVQVPVFVNGDTTHEATETFTVALTLPVGLTIMDGTGIGTIQNDDDPPTLSINDVAQAEGSAGGTTPMRFTASLSAASALPVTFTASTTPGSASTADYTSLVNANFQIPAGTSFVFVTVLIASGGGFETDERFFVDLANAAGATIARGRGTGIIQNDDATPALTNTITISDVVVSEGNSGTTPIGVVVTLNRAVAGTVSVNWGTADLTATIANQDYVAANGTITFPAGSSSQAVILTVRGDTLHERSEGFFVNLSGAVGATVVDSQAVVTIANDDATPTLSINNVTRAEGNAGSSNATFTVTLSSPSGQTVGVDYDLGGGTANPVSGVIGGADYVDASGTLTFAPGETSKTIVVSINGDATFEGDETFSANLSRPVNATISPAGGLASITNDDTAPTVTISDLSLFEGRLGTVPARLTVTISQPSALPVSFLVATVSGTATSPIDFTALFASPVSFNAGTTVTSLNVTVLGDGIVEANETFDVVLSMPTGCTLADGQATVTILNDD